MTNVVLKDRLVLVIYVMGEVSIVLERFMTPIQHHLSLIFPDCGQPARPGGAWRGLAGPGRAWQGLTDHKMCQTFTFQRHDEIKSIDFSLPTHYTGTL